MRKNKFKVNDVVVVDISTTNSKSKYEGQLGTIVYLQPYTPRFGNGHVNYMVQFGDRKVRQFGADRLIAV